MRLVVSVEVAREEYATPPSSLLIPLSSLPLPSCDPPSFFVLNFVPFAPFLPFICPTTHSRPLPPFALAPFDFTSPFDFSIPSPLFPLPSLLFPTLPLARASSLAPNFFYLPSFPSSSLS